MMERGNLFIIFFSFSILGCTRGMPICQTENSTITFSLFATDLSDCDFLSACDASVTILCSSIHSDWKPCGETREMENDNYPVWPEYFTFIHQPNSRQRWRLDLKDHDLIGTKLIASFMIIVDEYADNPSNLFQNEVPNNRGIHRRDRTIG